MPVKNCDKMMQSRCKAFPEVLVKIAALPTTLDLQQSNKTFSAKFDQCTVFRKTGGPGAPADGYWEAGEIYCFSFVQNTYAKYFDGQMTRIKKSLSKTIILL